MSFPSPNSREWSSILAHYSYVLYQPWGRAMHDLVTRLNDEGYFGAGLRGTTSMHALLLGRSDDVMNNPRLIIQPTSASIQIAYEEGAPTQWNIEVGFEELFNRVERLLQKRLRWFRQSNNSE